MIRHAKGNLIDMAEAGDFDVIVHGCNCQNTMGSGIAKQIKYKYPEAFDADTNYDKGSVYRYSKLGNYSHALVFRGGNKFSIINAYTQFHYLPRGIDHFEYASFAVILQKLAHYYGKYDFGFPYIGMGLAGGDPERITDMLEEFSDLVDSTGGSVTLVEYE